MPRTLSLQDLPTILGLSTNPSPWELFHRCKGTLSDPINDPSGRTWRNVLRPAIIEGIVRDHKTVFEAYDPLHSPEVPLTLKGLLYVSDPGSLPLPRGSDVMLIRMPEVDSFEHNWKASGTIEAPLTEIARAQLYMHAYGARSCALFVAAAYKTWAITEVPYDEAFTAEIYEKIAAFRQCLDTDEEPPIDFAIDCAAIFKMYPADDETPLDMTTQPAFKALLDAYQAKQDLLKVQKKQADILVKDVERIKGQIKSATGRSTKVLVDPRTTLNFKQIVVKESKTNGYSYQRMDVVHAGE